MFNISIAGLTIGIENRYHYVEWLCRNYITEDPDVDFTVSASEEEIQQQIAEGEEECTIEQGEALCIYRHICLLLPGYDAFLMHAVALEKDGQAYIFLAKSGVGKTTHARMWFQAFGDDVQIINGDKPILRRFDGRWYACGTPWCGKELLNCNSKAPVHALCFLERGQENSIRRVSTTEISSRLFQQLLLPQDEELANKLFCLLDDLLQQVPCYILSCKADLEAALVSYEGMR